MTDKQKAIVSLTLARDICSQALVLIQANEGSQSAVHSSVPFTVLRKDFISLLSFIYNATTKLALALKPSAPTYSACLAVLQDLIARLSALAHCVGHCDAVTHGATLRAEMTGSAKAVINGAGHLVRVFLTAALDSGDGGEYLIRVGELHDLVERAKTLSENNIGAARKRWDADRSGLEDALSEVAQMAEEEENVEGDGESAEFQDEDGWDELGIESGRKMDLEERERTKKVHALMRITCLLHKQILSILSPPSQPHPPNDIIDQLPSISSTLLTTTDDLVSSLYPPQDAPSLSTELGSWLQNIRSLEKVLEGFWRLTPDPPPLEQGLSEIHLGEPSEKGGLIKGKRWFETCFTQIFKLGDQLIADLDP